MEEQAVDAQASEAEAPQPAEVQPEVQSDAAPAEQPAEAQPEVQQEAQPEAAPPEVQPAEEPAAPAAEEAAPEQSAPAEAKSPLDLLIDKWKAQEARIVGLESVAHSGHTLDESAIEQIATLVLARINESISKRLS